MNFLLTGKRTIYGSFRYMHSDVIAYSLVEMYDSLFPIPQSDDHDVEARSQSSSHRTLELVNRFQGLELDTSTEEGSSSREKLSSQLAPSSTVTAIAGQVGEEHCPRIIGDSLGEALDFYESIQVGMPTVIWYSSNGINHRK